VSDSLVYCTLRAYDAFGGDATNGVGWVDAFVANAWRITSNSVVVAYAGASLASPGREFPFACFLLLFLLAFSFCCELLLPFS
jgi:hypothetical protein